MLGAKWGLWPFIYGASKSTLWRDMFSVRGTNYGFGFDAIAKQFKGKHKTSRKYNTPGVRMANGKPIPKGNK